MLDHADIYSDPDPPTNRGTLCPKEAALREFVRESIGLAKPPYRTPGATEWKEVSWDWALDCVARNFEDGRQVRGLYPHCGSRRGELLRRVRIPR